MEISEIVKLILAVIAIFTVAITITRLFGLRTFAKMSSIDFASTIAVGSVLATVIMNSNHPLIKGSIALLSIIIFQSLFSLMVRKSEKLRGLFTNNPQFLMWEGKVIKENLKSCNVGEDDVMAKLREANVFNLSEVKAVVFESTGDISVLHKDNYNDMDHEIFMGVDRKNVEF